MFPEIEQLIFASEINEELDLENKIQYINHGLQIIMDLSVLDRQAWKSYETIDSQDPFRPKS